MLALTSNIWKNGVNRLLAAIDRLLVQDNGQAPGHLLLNSIGEII